MRDVEWQGRGTIALGSISAAWDIVVQAGFRCSGMPCRGVPAISMKVLGYRPALQPWARLRDNHGGGISRRQRRSATCGGPFSCDLPACRSLFVSIIGAGTEGAVLQVGAGLENVRGSALERNGGHDFILLTGVTRSRMPQQPLLVLAMVIMICRDCQGESVGHCSTIVTWPGCHTQASRRQLNSICL